MERANTEEIRILLKSISKGYEVPKILYDEVMNAAKREIEGKERVVLFKRDPNIHRGRIQGRYVKITAGNTIDVHPATVGSHGADFDGDEMVLYVPLSEDAQQEIKDKMISGVSASSINKPNFELSKEMLTGIFTLTYEEKGGTPKVIKKPEEAEKFNLGQPVTISWKGKQKTTAGRVVFNAVLPEWYEFVNKPVDKKVLGKILSEIIQKSQNDFAMTIDSLMDLSFKYATYHPMSYGLDMMELSPSLKKLKFDLGVTKDVSEQLAIIKQMEKKLLNLLEKKHPDLYKSVASGGSKGVSQLRQLMVSKGLISDPEGNVLPPVTKSINDGFEPQEYFDASAGSRKGLIDRALNTAAGGYMARKMMYVTGDVTLNKTVKDCGTNRGLEIKLTKELFKKMTGRNVIVAKDKVVSISEDMIGQKIKIRSPMFCKTRAICPTCYGELYKQVNSSNIGTLAAGEMNFSERIMASFHTGGAVELKPVDIISEILTNVDDIFLSKIQKLLEQKGDDIYVITNMVMLSIDKKVYEIKPYIEEDDRLILPVGYFDLSVGDLDTPVTIEQETIVYKPDQIEEDAFYITFIYGKEDKLITVKPVMKDYPKMAGILEGIMGGKSPWTTASSLYMKFMKVFALEEPYDSVHAEVLLSNILRNSKNPQKPARIVEPYSPILISLKKLPGVISWPLGLGFENLSAALQQGMIADRSPSSPIEKVMFGESLIPKDKGNTSK